MACLRAKWSLLILAAIIHSSALGSTDRSEIQKVFFGYHLHWNKESNRVRFPKGAGSIRLWDVRANWNNLQPERSIWDFRRLDKLVHLAESNDLEIVYTLGGVPKWASSMPQVAGPYGPGTGSSMRSIDDWERYVRTVATRYKGRIRVYELMNEPVFKEHEGDCLKRMHFWCGGVKELVEIARRTKQVLSEIDHSILLVSPGFAGATAGREQLFLDAGGARYVDIVAHHFYAKSPVEMARRVREVRNVMQQSGVGHLPLWNTESGYTVGRREEDEQIAGVPNLNQKEMSAYVAQSLILAAGLGVERFYWYAWDNEQTGLTSNQGERVLPSGEVYQTVAAWLTSATLSECKNIGGSVTRCAYSKGDRRGVIAWSAFGGAHFGIDGPDREATLYCLDEPARKIATRDGLHLDEMPVLLEWSR